MMITVKLPNLELWILIKTKENKKQVYKLTDLGILRYSDSPPIYFTPPAVLHGPSALFPFCSMYLHVRKVYGYTIHSNTMIGTPKNHFIVFLIENTNNNRCKVIVEIFFGVCLMFQVK